MDTNTNGQVIGPTSFSFKGIAWGKVAGAGVAVVAALLTYISTWLTGENFGPVWTPIVMTVWATIATVGRKWISDNE